MKRFKQIFSTLTMIAVFFVIASVAMAQQPTMQKPQGVQEMQKPSAKPLPLKPDLNVDKVWIAKHTKGTIYELLTGDLSVGEKVLLVCEFSNIGGDLKGNWKIGYYIDEKLLYSRNAGDIPVGDQIHNNRLWC